MKSKSSFPIPLIIISLLAVIISSLLNPLLGILISIIIFILIIINIIYSKISLKRELQKKQKQKEEEERKKKEEYERIMKERKNRIEDIRKNGIKNLNFQTKINTTNVATSISLYQNDIIMVTFFGGKLIFYTVDLFNYNLIEILYIKEFDFNTYGASPLQGTEKNNLILVYGYPGIKILEININNMKGKEGNNYKVIQYLDCSEFNQEIIKVAQLDENNLISISTDYLLVWNKKEAENSNYIINKQKVMNFGKYENLLILSNLLALNSDNIVALKQSNSNMTRSTIDFIKIKKNEIDVPPQEEKIIDVDISPLDTGNNNLFYLDKAEDNQNFCVGCTKGLAIISGKYQELIQFIQFDYTIKNIDYLFDKYIILYGNFEKGDDKGEKGYTFIQLEDKKDLNNYKIYKKMNKIIEDDLNAIKCVKDGIVIIGDHQGFLQLWH